MKRIIQLGLLGLLLFGAAACGKGSAAAELGAADTIPVEVIAEHGVGDGHPATEVPIGRVADLATDPAGNIYFVDAVHLRVRRIGSDGVIETVFNGHALDVPSHPRAVAIGVEVVVGTAVYIADEGANRVWVIRKGKVETFAGTGSYGLGGDGGPASDADLHSPTDLAIGPDGTVYIADMGNHRIRAVAPDATIRTVAGDLASDADSEEGWRVGSLFLPERIAMASDAFLYVVDQRGRRLQTILPNGEARELSQDSLLTAIAVTSSGKLIAADAGRVVERREDRWNRIGNESSFNVVASLGEDVIAANWRDHKIYRLNKGGTPKLIGGNGTVGRFGDGGSANGATFSCYDILVGMQGEIVFTDTLNERIAVIRDDKISTLVEASRQEGVADNAVSLSGPRGIDIDSQGTLYVADAATHRVLTIDPHGNIEPVAGNGVAGFSGDGGSATAASLSSPMEVVVAADGEILISDSQNRRVRRVNSQGLISTVAAFDEPTGSLFLHPSGQLIVSMRAGLKLVELEASGEPAAVKLAASPDGENVNRLRRDAIAFTAQGELLFAAAGQLFATKDNESAAVLLSQSTLLAGATRMAVGANGDLVFCDARQRVLRIPAAALQDALAAASLR